MAMTLGRRLQSKTFATGVFIAAALFLGLRLHYNSFYYGRLHAGMDELHTYKQAVDTFYDRPIFSLRAQEGSRLLVKSYMPFAFYQVSNHMGGSIVDDWQSGVSAMQKADLMSESNPNVRLFIHSMRQQSVMLFFLSLLPVLYFLISNKLYVTAFGFLIYPGLSTALLEEQSYLYIEPSLMTFTNFQIGAFLLLLHRKSIKSIEILGLGTLAAFILSIKFLGALSLVLTPLLFGYVYREKFWSFIWSSLLWTASTLICYVTFNGLWNKPHSYIIQFAHDFYSNFWNYAQSGHMNPGWDHFWAARSDVFFPALGHAFDLSLVLFAIGMMAAKTRVRIILGGLGIYAYGSIFLLTKGHIFIPRNFVAYLFPLAILQLYAIDSCWKAGKDFLRLQWQIQRPAAIFLTTILICLFVPGSLWQRGPKLLSATIPSCGNAVNSFVTEQLAQNPKAEIIVFGYPESYWNHLKGANAIHYEKDFPQTFEDSEYRGIASHFQTLANGSASGSIVIARPTNHNFHLTNALLPTWFAKNKQWCDHFVFYN
jgi:hypothetical protein